MPKRISAVERRSAWRAQEERVIVRWNAAMERYRSIQREMSARELAPAGAACGDELAQKAQAARAEVEAVRRQVARLKREFLSGERY